MDFLEEINSQDWKREFSAEQQQQSMRALENGMILFFPQLNFELSPQEATLLSPQFSDGKNKNISFSQDKDLLQGTSCTGEQQVLLKQMMKRFVLHSYHLIKQLLPSYHAAILLGRTSFRPVEIAGRVAPSYRKDDTRLHIDAFPASPNQGKRILRIFSNINPHQADRLWHIGEPFEEVAKQFLPTVRRSWPGRSWLLKTLKLTRGVCTEYDYTMLQIHNNMKADLAYQKKAKQAEMRFPTGSTWMVQTDHVSHAALAGQHVLEQTFYLPVAAMNDQALSPLRVLERLTERKLI